MASISFFAWSAVFIGVFLGILLGKGGRPGFAGVVGLGIAGVLLGVGLSFAVGIAHSLCSGAKLCTATSDTTVRAITYPFMFVPTYWVAMWVGAAFASSFSGTTARPPGAGAAAIAAALEKFRVGAPIVEVCPSCRAVLVVKPAKPKPGRHPKALRLTCDCGASNGVYVAEESPA